MVESLVKNTRSTLSTVLAQLMASHDIDGVQLSKNTGVPTTTINRLRNSDPSTNPTLLTLLPIAKFFSVTISQLIGEERLPVSRQPKKIIHLPLLSWEEAINWPNVDQLERPVVHAASECSPNTFALVVLEDIERIEKGSHILIDPALSVMHLDYILSYKIGAQLPILKQIIIEDNITYLRSMLSSSIVTQLTPDYLILGVLIKSIKNFRQ